MRHLLKRYERLLRYLIVGGIGFVIDGGGMEILVHLGLSPFFARALSMGPAMACTYMLHRILTFRDAEKPASTAKQAAAFVASQLFGSGVNYVVFCIALLILPFDGIYERAPAFIAGTAAGLVVNYLLLSRAVFRPKK